MQTEHIIQAATACVAVMSMIISIVVYVHTISIGNDRITEDGRRAVRSVVIPAVTSFNGTINNAVFVEKRLPTEAENDRLAGLYKQSRDAFYVNQDAFESSAVEDVDDLVDRVEKDFLDADSDQAAIQEQREAWHAVMEKIRQEAEQRP